jgi:hypothetical protein
MASSYDRPDGKLLAPIEVPGREYACGHIPCRDRLRAHPVGSPFRGQHVENVKLVNSALPYRWQGAIIRADANAPLPYLPFGATALARRKPGDPFLMWSKFTDGQKKRLFRCSISTVLGGVS